MVIMLLPIGKLNMLIIIMTWEAVKKKGGRGHPSQPEHNHVSRHRFAMFSKCCVCV